MMEVLSTLSAIGLGAFLHHLYLAARDNDAKNKAKGEACENCPRNHNEGIA